MKLHNAVLHRALAEGEGPRIEFKRSTGELKEGMQTLCGFLNGQGGTAFFGVRPDGTAEGQEISDRTLRDIAQAADRFEPAVHLSIQRSNKKAGREVIAIKVDALPGRGPYTYDGRAYERVGSTTRRMPQSKYEGLLLDRSHGKRRWENEPAEGVTIRDIDRAEVYRIVEAARASGHLAEPVGSRLPGVLDHPEVRKDGRILQAALVLFGKKLMPDYPQCELRMARFRGLDKTEFLDQRNVRGPAFKLLEEAQIFCRRHFPLPGRIVPGKLQREDKPLIPPDAMREILVNALIHRDYSNAGGAIYLAIFDDRVEVWSTGGFPTGITPVMLSRDHKSVLRNPIIAEVFHRAGLIEKWGRGTNRVIAMCRQAGIRPPEFDEIAGSAVVRFRVAVGTTAESAAEVTTQVATQVTTQVTTQVRLLSVLKEEMTRQDLQQALGLENRMHFSIAYLLPALRAGLIEYTIPDKPNSRLQKYRLTQAGKARLAGSVHSADETS
ncbi:MAG: putative DNA binding domain-containing protein [Acidobacteria bacterium]|nr:putative DNA binding domain-containing protein [Acidobacteriota bacterium]